MAFCMQGLGFPVLILRLQGLANACYLASLRSISEGAPATNSLHVPLPIGI